MEPEQQEAFETLQRLCTEAPILAYAEFKFTFILHTDASSDGLGAVLYQNQDNQRRVIAYASRSLSPSERNYPCLQTGIPCLEMGPLQTTSMNICMVLNSRCSLTTTP